MTGISAQYVDGLELRIAELERERTLLFEAIGNLTYHAEMWEVKARNGQKRIAELQAELATARADNATLAGLALDASNIFSYTEPPDAA